MNDPGRAAATSDSARPDPHEPVDAVSAWRSHPVLEFRCYGELARLLGDPVFRGHGVPQGDGRSVLLLPGFLAPDGSLRVMAQFLRRIGYDPVLSGIRFNSGCGNTFDQRIVRTVIREHARSGRRLAVIGHSRGGHYTLGCTCEFSRGFAQPFPAQVRFTSIHSRNDGVVDWRSCIADYAICVEVTGSHIGLAFNRHAYRAVALALAGR